MEGDQQKLPPHTVSILGCLCEALTVSGLSLINFGIHSFRIGAASTAANLGFNSPEDKQVAFQGLSLLHVLSGGGHWYGGHSAYGFVSWTASSGFCCQFSLLLLFFAYKVWCQTCQEARSSILICCLRGGMTASSSGLRSQIGIDNFTSVAWREHRGMH